jgi:hypothetical protein
MKGLYAWVGFRSEPIEFKPGPRASGQGTVGLGRLFSLAADGLTSFCTWPLLAVSSPVDRSRIVPRDGQSS